MDDVFAGGSAQIKDVTATAEDESHQASQTQRTAEGPATPLPSKFKVRGAVGAAVLLQGPAGTQLKGVSMALSASSAFKGQGKQSEQPGQPSLPSTSTSNSSGQMLPPPIASQRLSAAKCNPPPPRSTSSSSSRTAHSDGEKDSRTTPRRQKSKEQNRASVAKHALDARTSALRKQDTTPQGPLPSLPSPHKKQPACDKGADNIDGSEDEEETQLILTEDAPSSSPAMASYDGEAELIMSGREGTPSREREEDSDDQSDSSSEEGETDDGEEDARRSGNHVKREREFDEYDDQGEFKRRDLGRRSPTLDQDYEEYLERTAYSQDDANGSYDHQQRSSAASEQPQQDYSPDQYQPHSYASNEQYPPPQAQFDPLAPVPVLFPGEKPYLQQAQARLQAQYSSIGVESRWEGCSLEEWKHGGDELSARFAALMGRVVQLVAKKTARTEGFKQQMKQHRDELQEHETKLEGTKKGLSQWASVVGL